MKKVKVDPGKCIGCATCVGMADKSFKIDEKTGKAVAINPPGDDGDKVQTAIESCPAEAISEVDDSAETKTE